MFDVSLHVFTTISNFWSSNVVNLVSRKDEGIKPIVFGAFSCRESAFKSCARWNKTRVRQFFEGCINLYFVRKSR